MVQPILTGVIVLLVVIQIFKSLLEASGTTADSQYHDPLIWLFSLLAGVGGYIGYAAIAKPLTGAIIQDQAGQGFLAVVTCIGAYHLTTHNYFQQNLSGVATTLAPHANITTAAVENLHDEIIGHTALLEEIAANTVPAKADFRSTSIQIPGSSAPALPFISANTPVTYESTSPTKIVTLPPTAATPMPNPSTVTSTSFPDGTTSLTGPVTG